VPIISCKYGILNTSCRNLRIFKKIKFLFYFFIYKKNSLFRARGEGWFFSPKNVFENGVKNNNKYDAHFVFGTQ